MADQEMSLGEHLGDLRRVLMVSAVAVLVTSGVIFGVFRQQLMDFILQPLEAYDVPLVYIRMTEAFFAQFKLSLMAGLVVSMPVILWELWRFVAPALKPAERRLAYGVVPTAVILFFAGVVFAYFTVLQVIVRFLLMFGGEVEAMLSIEQYISFLLTFLVPFGIIFELPVIVFFMVRVGWLTVEGMTKNRKYALLISFVAAAVLTPSPDPISQTMMAVPVFLLYEVGILVARVTTKRMKKAQALEEATS